MRISFKTRPGVVVKSKVDGKLYQITKNAGNGVTASEVTEDCSLSGRVDYVSVKDGETVVINEDNAIAYSFVDDRSEVTVPNGYFVKDKALATEARSIEMGQIKAVSIVGALPGNVIFEAEDKKNADDSVDIMLYNERRDVFIHICHLKKGYGRADAPDGAIILVESTCHEEVKTDDKDETRTALVCDGTRIVRLAPTTERYSAKYSDHVDATISKHDNMYVDVEDVNFVDNFVVLHATNKVYEDTKEIIGCDSRYMFLEKQNLTFFYDVQADAEDDVTFQSSICGPVIMSSKEIVVVTKNGRIKGDLKSFAGYVLVDITHEEDNVKVFSFAKKENGIVTVKKVVQKFTRDRGMIQTIK